MKLPLIMTASVSTRGMKGACFDDATRARMYAETLAHYLKTLPDDLPIVFAENSGFAESEFRALVPSVPYRDFEYVAVPPELFDQSRGKGYNEIILVGEALRRSRAFADGAAAFFKVTGRYPVYNLGDYLDSAERFLAQGGEYYGDMKDHRVYDTLFPRNTAKWNGHAAYTVLFASTVGFWNRELAPTAAECNDYTGDWIECVWFRKFKSLLARSDRDSRVLSLRFRREPVLGGLQGSDANTAAFSKSNTSFKARTMRFVGNCIRIFTPWFWF